MARLLIRRSATVTQPGYVDFAPPAGDKFYVVTAVNAVGEGPYCKAFAPPTGPVETPCVLPGRLISNDLLPNGSDNDTGANVSPDPRTNIKFLHIGEPFVGGADQLFFTMQVAPSTAGYATAKLAVLHHLASGRRLIRTSIAPMSR